MTNATGRAFLLEILSWARPHGSITEQRFCREYLDTVPGMQEDAFGNRYLRIGDAPILWSCHVDTVAKRGGPQLVVLDTDDIAKLAKGKPGMSLGADDGAGLWIMLNMIAAQRPGLYVFHRGEEVGCLGSSWIRTENPKFLDGIKAAIAFDRAHLDDVITHQSYGRTCSQAFALSMSAALNGLDQTFAYKPDDTGVYTDTNEYAGIIPECTNLSVGYYGQHGPREVLDVAHCERLMRAMLKLDWQQLVIERDPAVRDFDDGPWSNWREQCDLDDMVELITEAPMAAARLLRRKGFTADDLLEELCGMFREHEDDHDYRPLTAA